MGAQKTIEQPRWRSTALAVAAAALLGLAAPHATALGLGRISVQSALGEPLRAEIDIPEINAEELASFRTTVASPEAFKSAGLDYNPAVASIRITLERRADGRHFLRLVSSRPVSDPFVDLILETQWSSGRIVRDYTMLFDPPSSRQQAPLAAQVTPAAPAARAALPPPAQAQSPAPASAGRAQPARAPAAQPRQAAAPRPSGAGTSKQVTVQAGDTAGRIASANKPANISLDQMLVAMLRANPDAFIGGNVNRLKAGSVLDVPTGEEATAVSADEARQTVVAQSRDFNEFRRKLAEGVPTSRTPTSDRQASGKVQAKVEEKKPGAATPDKLTLSKGAVQGKAPAVEDKIARDRAAKDAASRVAELNKNIADLNRLGTASAPVTGGASAAKPAMALPVGAASAVKPASAAAPAAPAAAPVAAASAAKPASAAAPASAAKPASAPAAAAPVAPAPAAMASAAKPAASVAAAVVTPPVAAAPVAAPVATPAPAASAPAATPLTAVAPASAPAAAAPASAPTAAASAPVAPPAAAAKPAPAPAPVETSLIDDMLENPIVPATLGGVLALLLGFGIYRAQQRRKSTQVDSSFLESRLQPDSFFGASGGQRIDTNEGGATGSSMVYSPSQLDAAGDVDPVAEADVYLAYGRDLQAEEILKEAMRTSPQRVAIHAKLLEIYAKRRDTKAFELVATEAYGLTHGEGPEWEHICELGTELDAGNTLYRPGGQPSAAAQASMTSTVAGHFAAATQPMPVGEMSSPAAQAPDVDLDLDFSLDDPVADSQPAPLMAATEPTMAMSAQAVAPPPSLDMDFGAATVSLNHPPQMKAPDLPEPVRLDVPDLNLDSNALNIPAPAPQAAVPAPAPASGMIEFDLGALSLDLGDGKKEGDTDDAPLSTAGSPLTASTDDGPLATKLALAEEFNAIGDPDGARSLAAEVVAEASGDLKDRAQRFLAEIS